jgi:hypothetical protein
MAKKQSRKAKRRVPKTVLRLPDLDQAKSAVLNSLSSVDAQRGYRHAIDEFVEWYCSEPRLSFSKTVVLRQGNELKTPFCELLVTGRGLMAARTDRGGRLARPHEDLDTLAVGGESSPMVDKPPEPMAAV